MSVRLSPPGRIRRSPVCSTALSAGPRQELIETGDLVLGDPAKHIGEPGLRVDTVQLCRLDQGVDNGPGRAAALGAYEGEVLPVMQTSA